MFLALLLAAAPAATLSPVDTKDGGWSRTLTFTDKAGAHEVKFSLTPVKERTGADGDDLFHSRWLLVVHTLAGKEVWRTKDFVEDCKFDLTLEFFEDSLEVTDVDENGLGEVSFAYQLGCRSDVSALTAKLLLYQGTAKYALRGESRYQSGEKEFSGGAFKADPAFDKAPKSFLPFAKAKWKRVVIDPVDATAR